MNSRIQTFPNSKSIRNKFVLLTYLDRINLFSDIFIKHYKQIFDIQEFKFILHWKGEQELKDYLISHGFTQDNFLINGRSRKNFGYGEQTPRQNSLKSYFLSQGYTVVYADIDELIYHVDFKRFILQSPEKLFCARGIQIVQQPSDPYLDVTQPIFKQRTMGKCDVDYSKVCVLKEDFFWTPGRHNKGGVPIQDSLWIFDIGRVCKRIMIENHRKNTELYQGIYPRYRICDMEELEQEYASWLKYVCPLPQDVIERCPF